MLPDQAFQSVVVVPLEVCNVAFHAVTNELLSNRKGISTWVVSGAIFAESSGELSPEGDFDRQALDETWGDMVRCQKEHIYPDTFVNITCPVVMIHGEYDPHPGRVTAEYLKSCIPQLEYKEFPRCGHAPDIEKYARRDFYDYLVSWLTDKTGTGPEK